MTKRLVRDETASKAGEGTQQDGSSINISELVIADKAQGVPDVELGRRYGISFRQLERIITVATGANVSVLQPKKRITSWEPKEFKRERTTVWSFKGRGNWATHDGRYRGNWSPYIPRNVIIRYSQPGEVVLDQFVGGGTSAVEAKLLGRLCIARDINPSAILVAKQNLLFEPPARPLGSVELIEPVMSVGDACCLSGIADESVDLILTHPPYAGIIDYSASVEGDLSKLSPSDFVREMGIVARECFRVLKPGRQCAVLIGDGRKEKHVVPTGFETILAFLNAGFRLRELVIKRQHNCKSTGFWYKSSVKHNFLLLAHEYLPIFDKPGQENGVSLSAPSANVTQFHQIELNYQPNGELETMTVWLLSPDDMEKQLVRNVTQRFGREQGRLVQLVTDGDGIEPVGHDNTSLVFVRFPIEDIGPAGYKRLISEVAQCWTGQLIPGGFFVVEAKDVRRETTVEPMGLHAYEAMRMVPHVRLKEIIVVLPNLPNNKCSGGVEDAAPLDIIHRYLLVYAVPAIATLNNHTR